MKRPCIDCGEIATDTRCGPCRAARKRLRNSDRHIATAVRATATRCAKCNIELTPWDPQGPAGPTVQHRTPLAHGGRLDGTEEVWCRSCNARHGARPA